MVVSFFRKSRSAAILAIPVLALGLSLFHSFFSPEPSPSLYMPLYEPVADLLLGFRLVSILVNAGLITAGAFLLNRICTKMEILNTTSYMPGLVYVLFMGSSVRISGTHPLLFTNVFILLVLMKMFQTHRKETAFGELFDSGTLLGISVLFFFPSFVFIPLVWICLTIIRPFICRGWIIGFLGFLIPFIFVAAYFFLRDGLESVFRDKIISPFSEITVSFDIQGPSWLLAGLVLFIVLVSLPGAFRGKAIITLRAKNHFLILLWFLILGLVGTTISPYSSEIIYLFCGIPLSVFIANFFLSVKRIFLAEFLAFSWMVFILLNQFLWENFQGF